MKYEPHFPSQSHGFSRPIFAEEFSNLQPGDKFVPPPAKWGGRHTVTLLPGDGIGQEMGNHVKEIFRYAAAPVDFEEIDLDATTPDVEGFEYALMSIKRNGVALKGEVFPKCTRSFFLSKTMHKKLTEECVVNQARICGEEELDSLEWCA